MKLLRLLALLAIGFSVNAFAQCAALPCVVTSISLTNQNQPIRSTPLFTPAASGLFRISTYLSTSSGILPDAMWGFEISWKDDEGGRNTGFDAIPRHSYFSTTTIAQSQAGQPLDYFVKPVTINGQLGGLTYNLFITVEQLQ